MVLFGPAFLSPRRRSSDESGSSWSARSAARTNELDAGEERRMLSGQDGGAIGVEVGWVVGTRGPSPGPRDMGRAGRWFGCRAFLRRAGGAWCVSGHSQDGLTQLPRPRPQLRGATSFDELASWLCPNLLSWPRLGQTADLTVSKPVVDQCQKLSGGGDAGDHLSPSVPIRRKAGAMGAPPW